MPKVQLKKKNFNFLRSIWKILHLSEFVYTDAICGVCDKYQVCALVAHKFVYLKHVAWGWGDCHKYPKYISRGNNWAQNIDLIL